MTDHDQAEMAAMRQRILDLERENAELRRQQARRVVVPGTRPELLPDERQLHELRDIVLRRYPALRGNLPDERFDQCFEGSFRALLSLPRTTDSTVNWRIEKITFLERAEHVLRRQGGPSITLPLAPFLCALIAHNDIPYAPLTHYPSDIAFGLGNYSGRMPDGSGWRALLDTRRVREPTPVEMFERARRRSGEVVGFTRQLGPTW